MPEEVKYTVGANCDVKLRFDDDEVIRAGVKRELGLRLKKIEESYNYRAYDDASREIVDQVSRAGYSIDPQTLKIQFDKSDWSGNFGAYTERPGDNRFAFGVGWDTRFHKPIFGPQIKYITGLSARMSSAIEFKGTFYLTDAGRKVYKLTNWTTTPTLTAVFTHSNADAVLRDMIVYKDVLYAAAGETAAYAYSSDGASWTEAVASADDTVRHLAEAFRVVNGVLHKIRVPNIHYQTVDGTNGGVEYDNGDEIGDSAAAVAAFEILAQLNAVVFAKEEGAFNMDAYGNITDLFPELQKTRDAGNGFHSFVWHQKLFFPTLWGELMAMIEGSSISVTPAKLQERRLEVGSLGSFIGRVRAMAGTTDYLYVQIKKPSDNSHRVLTLEERNGVFTWRTLFDLPHTTSDEMFISSGATSGPVLWFTAESDRVGYCILPAGPDPTQDSRYRFQGGTFYDPWNDFGCPTTPKRIAEVKLEVAGTVESGVTITFRLVADDGRRTQRTISVGEEVSLSQFKVPKDFIARRFRVEIEGGTTDSTGTGVLISYGITAYALPDPVRVWQYEVDASEKGTRDMGYTQKDLRMFMDAVRRAEIPLYYWDLYSDNNHEGVWNVIPFPPPPAEQAQRNPAGGRWDESWTLALIEQKTREFEILHPVPDDGTPPGGDETVLPPDEKDPGDVSVEFIVTWLRSGAVRFTYTLDRTVASPTWVNSSVGLPTSGVTEAYHVLYPWDTENQACIKVNRSGAQRVEVWQNKNYRGLLPGITNEWTLVFDFDIAAAAFTIDGGITAMDDEMSNTNQNSLHASITTEGVWVVGFGVNTTGSTVNFVVIRTEDNWATLASYVAGAVGRFQVVLGQWSDDFIWANRYSTIAQSFDSAVSVSGAALITLASSGPGWGNASTIGVLPYANNQNYNKFYAFSGVNSSTGAMHISSDRQATLAGWQTRATGIVGANGFRKHAIRVDPILGRRIVLAGLDASTLGVINFSNNEGITWDGGLAANRPNGASADGDLGTPIDLALWPGGGLQIGICHSRNFATPTNAVQYSEDCLTFVDVTGNLASVLTAFTWIACSISFGLPND